VSSAELQLQATRQAFDSVAAEYDGPTGNNALIQRMRTQMWHTVTASLSGGAQLLDLGCGTGIDVVYFASRGYSIVATDWSPHMVERTRSRVVEAGLEHRVRAEVLGVHEIAQLHGERFDGIYSDLGPFNCVPDLDEAAQSCAALLEPGGRLVASVIGRICPWELVYYALQGKWERARIRSTPAVVPVPLNQHVVWTRYFTPREFFRPFASAFQLTSYRGLSLFVPPPYLIRIYERFPALGAVAGWLDDHIGALPLLRNAGDHFLMVMTRRAESPHPPTPDRGRYGRLSCAE
jgi:SAM-dependent methyltransferase